jgi:hypothetical protein
VISTSSPSVSSIVNGANWFEPKTRFVVWLFIITDATVFVDPDVAFVSEQILLRSEWSKRMAVRRLASDAAKHLGIKYILSLLHNMACDP